MSLISRAGYFHQEIDGEGRRVERPDWWEIEKWCTPLHAMIAVEIENKPVWIRQHRVVFQLASDDATVREAYLR